MALLAALAFSGVGAIINQIIWQRALKVFVAGSEAISSMIVILVFMFGLGFGAVLIGLRVHRLRNPLRALALVEFLLFVANLAVAFVLGLGLSEEAADLVSWAYRAGIPLPALFSAAAILAFSGPCLLMGTTVALASEAAQRQLRVVHPSFVSVLFALNTVGAVIGAAAAGLYLLPLLGQERSLLVAASANAVAAMIALGLSHGAPAPPRLQQITQTLASLLPRNLRSEESLGFWLGFLSLAYEMYVLRAVAVACEPIPYNFALVLGFYLLMWSIGVWVSRWTRGLVRLFLIVSAMAILFAPILANWFQLLEAPRGFVIWSFTLPCLAFGVLFGQLVESLAVHWGTDVGRYHGLNTIGACLGIVVATLVGYEIPHGLLSIAIACGYLLLGLLDIDGDSAVLSPFARRVGTTGTVAIAAMLAWFTISRTYFTPAYRLYVGREGVVEVTGARMWWDGLWHSNLSDGFDHVASNNWLLSVVPLLAHSRHENLHTLVIGLGTGITAATLARSSAVDTTDVYEINPELKRLLVDYPTGTLQLARHDDVRIRWQDARTGMIVDPSRYDVITQQPLYLKQAGSAMLLSEEYMRLVRSRLAPGGVFTIYCNSLGHPGQALAVRKAASRVFPHTESFGRGYMIVASNEPFVFTPHSIQAKLDLWPEDDPVRQEIERVGGASLAGYLDVQRLEWHRSPISVTDDWPIVEYPDLAQDLVTRYFEELGLPPIEH